MDEFKEHYHLNLHHHHIDRDDSEIFKLKSLSAQKRRKIMANVTFTALCLIAFIIIIAVVWMYTA